MQRRLTFRAASLLALMLVANALVWHRPAPVPEPAIAQIAEPDGLEMGGLTLPRVLSETDVELYQRIFQLEAADRWEESDTLAARLTNRGLMGHVLANRYLSPDYESSFDELVAWLNTYPSQPQTDRIYELALNKNPSASLPAADTSPSLGGFGDDNGLNRQPVSTAWRTGLNAWESKHYAEAADYFTKAYAASAADSAWEKSAAAFWASRALRAAGRKDQAQHYLSLAAEHPRTFYGIIAMRQLGRSLALNTDRPELDSDAIRLLSHNPAIQRAIGLVQIGQSELADRELRQAYLMLPSSARAGLLTLADALDLPSVQITMARLLAKDDTSYDFALYPRPQWSPESGFRLTPALIYAFARQESGFRISAQSGSGAIGLMQLMPRTAELVNRRTRLIPHDRAHERFYEPSLNLSLGQAYLAQLMTMDRIGNNLVLLAAAYNAGPGKALQWQSEIQTPDPLLFVERIPYGETRHYVKQVMTNFWIYSALEGNPTDSALALAQNRWPTYDATALQTASLN